MQHQDSFCFLFVINPSAGSNRLNWSILIDEFFEDLPHQIHKYYLEQAQSPTFIKDKINEIKPDRVVAVGGDGTVKLVADALLNTNMAMGILPAGSANGMARELGIPLDPAAALAHLLKPETQNIHLLRINDQICAHLSDIGLNASMVKIFEADKTRGKWGYFKAAWKAFRKYAKMNVTIQTDAGIFRSEAVMIVIANATKYGSGALINPIGRLDDDLFEIIVIKQLSVIETFKMLASHHPYDTHKTQIYQTRTASIQCRGKVQFQVDGEWLGETDRVDVELIPKALYVIK